MTWESDDLTGDEAVAKVGWAHGKALIEQGEHRLLVLDEITYPMTWGWIDTAEVVATIAGRPEAVNVVCTGRDAPAELVAVADTVTEMRKVKNAYETGCMAKQHNDDGCPEMGRASSRERV